MITILGYLGFLGAFFVSTLVIYFGLLKTKLI